MPRQEIVRRWTRLLRSGVCHTSGSYYLCYLNCTSWIGPHAAIAFYNKRLTPHSSRVPQFCIDIHWSRCVSKKMSLVLIFSCVSHSCQSLLWLQASAVTHQRRPGPIWSVTWCNIGTWRNNCTFLCSMFGLQKRATFKLRLVGGREPGGGLAQL